MNHLFCSWYNVAHFGIYNQTTEKLHDLILATFAYLPQLINFSQN